MAGRALIDPTSTVAVSPVKELHNALFGGTLVNATVCQNCGHASKRTDPFSELPLTFPSSFTPIIDVTVVCGDSADVAPPSGYDRLPVNVNQGRAGSPFVYLCVRRARSWDDQEVSSADTDGSAITDVCIVTAPLSTAPALPLPPSGFTLLDDDLNEGGTVRVFLALARVPNGCPITALDVGAAQTAKNVKTPHGFEKLPENINAGTTGDVVYLFYKRGGAIRDVVLVGSSHEHKSVPPGYVCVGVDVGMVGTGCIDDEGPECDSATTRIAYTTGGSLAPITGIRVLDRDGLAALLASTDVATGTVMSDISIQSRAKRGVASVPLGSAYGWSSIGVLPGGRYVAVQRGHGSPLGSLSVYRSPAVVPRYGLSGVVDMLPADTLSACLGFTPPPPVPDTASPFTALPKACASVLGKWRSIEGNVNSLTLRPSEPLQRVVGFQVFGMLGDLEEAVPSSGSDVEEEEGKAAPPVEMLSRTGSVLGVLYRPLEDHLAAAGSCAGNWVLDGEWNALDDDDDTYPLRLHVTIPADPSKPPSFSGKRASSVVRAHVCLCACVCVFILMFVCAFPSCPG